MMKYKAYKYRIYPTTSQAELFAKTFGCVRFIYNKMLADKVEHYATTKEMLKCWPSQYKNEYSFLKEVDSLALVGAYNGLQSAYKNFFQQKRVGFPKFKKKKFDASYTTNMMNGNIALVGGALKLPKAGYVRIKLHRQLPSEAIIKSVTISRTPTGKYYASILAEMEIVEPKPAPISEAMTIGLDYSSGHFYVDSEGLQADYPKYYRQAEQKLTKAQRQLSRKQKGSKNREKARHKVAAIHEKISNQRYDFLHKQSALIAKKYDTVCVEDLHLRGIAGGLKLGKATMDNGFGLFRTLLQYKLEDQGKHFVVINKWYPSSKECSHCGHINKELKLSDRVYVCPKCNLIIDRDHNAATNIKKEGLRKLIALPAA